MGDKATDSLGYVFCPIVLAGESGGKKTKNAAALESLELRER